MRGLVEVVVHVGGATSSSELSSKFKNHIGTHTGHNNRKQPSWSARRVVGCLGRACERRFGKVSRPRAVPRESRWVVKRAIGEISKKLWSRSCTGALIVRAAEALIVELAAGMAVGCVAEARLARRSALLRRESWRALTRRESCRLRRNDCGARCGGAD